MALNSDMVASVGTVRTNVGTAVPASNVRVLLGLTLANRLTSSSIKVAAGVTRAAVDYYLIRDMVLSIGSMEDIVAGAKIVLEASDQLWVESGTASSLDAVASYDEGAP